MKTANIEHRNHGWYCPNCNHFNRVRGIGNKKRRCQGCRIKIPITTEYYPVPEWRIKISAINGIEVTDDR